MGVAERSKDAPRSARSRGFLLQERARIYAKKSNKGIDRGCYVGKRRGL